MMIKHGVGSTEFSKMIKEIEKVTTKATNAICMHCGSAQGKILLDKPTTFKEKKDKGEHKLNPRDIREWLEKFQMNILSSSAWTMHLADQNGPS